MVRGNPVPLVLAAAVAAAFGPPAVSSLRSLGRRGRGRTSPRPTRGVPGTLFGSSAYEADGSLEDARTLDQARAMLETWRAEGPELAGPSLAVEEAALGLAMLEFVRSTSVVLADLDEVVTLARSVVAARPQRPPSLSVSLRKATTAAARRVMGKGRDGDAAIAARRSDFVGLLLVLTRRLLSTSVKEAAEVSAVRYAFGMGGEPERAESARRSAALRLFRSEVRRVLPKPKPSAGGLPSGSTVTLSGAMAKLPSRLGVDASELRAPLLAEAVPTLRSLLEAALSQWIRAGGTPASEAYSVRGGAGVEADAALDRERDRNEEQRAAFATAAAASDLALGCLHAFDGAGSGFGSGLAGSGAADLEGLQSLGLTSQARHDFYAAYVFAACVDAAEARGGAADAVVEAALALRKMLAVLPNTASRAEADAVSEAGRRAARLGLPGWEEKLRRGFDAGAPKL